MRITDLLWGMALVGMTVPYEMTFMGVETAMRHDVASHRKWMTIGCTLLTAYGVYLMLFYWVSGGA